MTRLRSGQGALQRRLGLRAFYHGQGLFKRGPVAQGRLPNGLEGMLDAGQPDPLPGSPSESIPYPHYTFPAGDGASLIRCGGGGLGSARHASRRGFPHKEYTAGLMPFPGPFLYGS